MTTATPVVRILLVDDQPMLRTGFKVILEGEPDLTVVGEAGDGLEAVELARSLQPDVVLMDIRMPRLDGVEATGRITAAGTAKVLILTTFDLDEYVVAALRSGASGFLLKDAQASDLIAAIRVVAAGEAVVSPRVTRKLLERFTTSLQDAIPRQIPSLDVLTAREREVLMLMGQGRSNAEIAAELFVGEATVKTHVGNVLMKLNLRDRVQAVVLAYDTGLVRPATT